MTEATMPSCPCGAGNHYKQGGGSFGCGYSRWFWCPHCNRALLETGQGGMSVLFVPKAVSEGFSERVQTWADTILAAVRRDYEARWEKLGREWERENIYLPLCAEFGFPDGTKLEANQEHQEYLLQLPNGTFLTDKEQLKRWRDSYRDLFESRPYPSELLRAPDPPQVPEEIRLYVLRKGTWEYVDPEESASQEPPKDPLRVRHEEWWGGIFRVVSENIGIDLDPEEVPNRYWGDPGNCQPWYEFQIGDVEFLVGPRKRVDSLEARSNGALLDVTKLGRLAAEDRVTYEADGGWQSKVDRSSYVLIHAWTKEKSVEYLTMMIQTAIEATHGGTD